MLDWREKKRQILDFVKKKTMHLKNSLYVQKQFDSSFYGDYGTLPC